MKTSILPLRLALSFALALFCSRELRAQINTGSDGSDGALNPTTNIVINMADHPNGIYQYTSVNISDGVTVTFISNANNTPVVWLVQSNVQISGEVSVAGHDGNGTQGGLGGPGGYLGGKGANGDSPATSGQGPGGGIVSGGYGSYNYGNSFLIPLLGGSGGAGADRALDNTWLEWHNGGGGGGGSGSILIAANQYINVSGSIIASGGGGGKPDYYSYVGGSGSGGGIRLAASQLTGNGRISGARVRFDTFDDEFTGSVGGAFSKGSQFIIIPLANQLPQLTVTSVGGVAVSASPTGILSTPDAVLWAQQNNPISIVVQCSNVPLNSQITVNVKPMNGAAVSATGLNSVGTVSSSTATIQINIPRGGGLIYATAVTAN